MDAIIIWTIFSFLTGLLIVSIVLYVKEHNKYVETYAKMTYYKQLFEEMKTRKRSLEEKYKKIKQ